MDVSGLGAFMARRENYQEGRSEGQNDPLNLGDEAAPGTLGTGENVWPALKGSSNNQREACMRYLGTGLVQEDVGGGRSIIMQLAADG